MPWKRKRGRGNNNNNTTNDGGDDGYEVKRRRDDRDDRDQQPGRRGKWEATARENERFTSYYKSLNLMSDEEFEAFSAILKTPLPTTFRITSNRSVAPIVLDRIKTHFIERLQSVVIDKCVGQRRSDKYKVLSAQEDAMSVEPTPEASAAASSSSPSEVSEAPVASDEAQLQDVAAEDGPEYYQPPKPIPWYPDELGWHFSASRILLRKDANLHAFHQFLIAQTAAGTINRQEAVSMIPPLLLRAEPQHRILDMCAAPGSKTLQLLESMLAATAVGTPDGMVIANDLDEKRCYMLFHQIKRIMSPSGVVTNHEAQLLPIMRDPATGERLLFDRVLADVPCSGDGTLRKNFDLWQRWVPTLGLGLHRIQVQIGLRGIQQLQVGGRMVYSTCSMNPIENEAVVAELLRRNKGLIEIEDASNELVGLIRRPGITSWHVQDKGNQSYRSLADVTDRKRKQKIMQSMFPPSAEEIEWMHLERCMRIYPHLQDTGGFFITVLRKIAKPDAVVAKTLQEEDDEPALSEAPSDASIDVATTAASETAQPTDGLEASATEQAAATPATEPAAATTTAAAAAVTATTTAAPAKKEQAWRNKEAPFLRCDSEYWQKAVASIKEFFDISDDFPFQQLMARSENGSPNIYFLSKELERYMRADVQGRLHIVNTGLRMFAKHTSKDCNCDFRICFEGVEAVAPYMSDKRKVPITKEDLLMLLTEKDPFLHRFSAKDKLQQLEMGGLVFEFDASVVHPAAKKMAISAWRGKTSCHLLMAKEELRVLIDCFVPEEQAKSLLAAKGKPSAASSSSTSTTAEEQE